MKIVIFILGCVFSSVAFYLFSYIGVFDMLDSVSGVEKEPHYSLPTYLSFISVMMTAVTVVLTVFAITIGVISFYTIKEIKKRAVKTATRVAITKATEVATEKATNVATEKATEIATKVANEIATKEANKVASSDNIEKLLFESILGMGKKKETDDKNNNSS